MEKPLAVGAASGSLSAVLIQLLSGLASVDPIVGCPDCPVCVEQLLRWEAVDIPSLIAGLLLGLCIGPVLDLLQLLRQSWKVWLQSKLVALEKGDSKTPLYKIL